MLSLLALALLGCQEVNLSDASQPPELTLLRPVDGGRFDPNSPVEVCAAVDWDGDVAALGAVVISDLDGTVASEGFGPCDGGDLGVTVTLSAAAHVLSMTLTDPQGRTASTAATIQPLDNGSPTCAIVAPAPGDLVDSGQAVDVEVTVDDPDGDLLVAVLSSDVDGALGTQEAVGGSTLLYQGVALSDGPHALSVQVTDPSGLVTTCGSSLEILACLDLDADGFDTCSGDCDDDAPHTNPLQPELPDGQDNDCDGDVDEGTALADDDGDGFNELQGDCDDTDATINPDEPEIPDDGIDQDCSGTDEVSCYTDADGDDYGVAPLVLAPGGDCFDPGLAPVDGDCDDTSADRYPGAAEIPADGIDQDCDGTDPAGCFSDGDADGYGTPTVLPPGDADCDDPGESPFSTDCDDTVVSVNPGAIEILGDGIDQDCNGTDAVACFEDLDFDGFGGPTEVIAPDGTCDTGDNESTNEDDCDDTDASVNPLAAEIPGDGIDQDCDGSLGTLCFEDLDEDGYGSGTTIGSADADCDDPGESIDNGDCDDTDPNRHPGLIDIPDDGIDQDCDTRDATICFEDLDQDGYGTTIEVLAADGACNQNQRESLFDTDCDDAAADANPNGVEVPDDGIDQDCSGADAVTCYVDDDQDGFGSTTVVIADDGSCDLAARESATDDDCDDTDATIFPGADDSNGTDGIDQDCNGVDGADADNDGFGSSVDCDDTDAAINPGATEVRDAADNNCDGLCDEGFIVPGDLVITEVHSDSEAVSDIRGEWFELHNPGTEDIALCGGWTFRPLSSTVHDVVGPVVVPAGGYVVAAASGDPARNGGVTVDYAYDRMDLALGNNAGGNALRVDFDGVLIDQVTWNNEVSAGSSRQLSSDSLDATSNDAVVNWCDSTTPWSGSDGDDGSPGEPNAVCP